MAVAEAGALDPRCQYHHHHQLLGRLPSLGFRREAEPALASEEGIEDREGQRWEAVGEVSGRQGRVYVRLQRECWLV